MNDNYVFQGYSQPQRDDSDELPVRMRRLQLSGDMNRHDAVLPRMEYVFVSPWAMPGFIIPPRLSADGGDSYLSITLDLFFDNSGHYLIGERLNNVVRRGPGY